MCRGENIKFGLLQDFYFTIILSLIKTKFKKFGILTSPSHSYLDLTFYMGCILKRSIYQ